MGRRVVLAVVALALLAVVLASLAGGLLEALLGLLDRRSGGWEEWLYLPEKTYPILDTLNYTLVGAREHAPLIWGMMSEHRRSDPRVAGYLEWLEHVLSPRYRGLPFKLDDYIVIDTPVAFDIRGRDYRALQAELPANNTVVRMGYARLPFGYGVIVTAYQDSSGYLNMVVHGTVVDEEEFMELVYRVLSYPLFTEDRDFVPIKIQDCLMPAERERCSDNVRGYDYRFKLRVYWVLWRITLAGKGYLEVNETLRIPIAYVYVLIEMPLLGVDREGVSSDKVYAGTAGTMLPFNRLIVDQFGYAFLMVHLSLEPAYFSLSHPVFGIASNFAYVHENVGWLMAAYGVSYMRPHYGFRTVLYARVYGYAVCEGASSSTALAVSTLGYPAASVTDWRHDIGVRLMLSSLNESGLIQLEVDVDGDGVNDSYDVIIDTAEYPREVLRRDFTREFALFCAPLICKGSYYRADMGANMGRMWNYSSLAIALYGTPQAVLGLPEWMKTPALVRYQFLTEELIRRSLSDLTLYQQMVEKRYLIIRGYYYDPEADELVPAPDPSYYFMAELDIDYLLLAEPAFRAILRDKGVTPGLFTPPSASAVEGLLGYVSLLHEDRRVPQTRGYVLEAFKKLDEMRSSERRAARLARLLLWRVYVPPPPPPAEPPVELPVFLSAVYRERWVSLGEGWVEPVRHFDYWEGRVRLDRWGDSVVRLYRLTGDTYRLEVYPVSWLWMLPWYQLSPLYAVDFDGLPANGTRVELEAERPKVALIVYYEPAEHPSLGAVEVREEHLTLYAELEVWMPGEGYVPARFYAVNATRVRNTEGLVERRGGTVIIVFGVVGTTRAALVVEVNGLPTLTTYTARAELTFPNGTTIQLPVVTDFNPPYPGYLILHLTTDGVLQARLSGSTITMTVQELNLTVTVKIPDN